MPELQRVSGPANTPPAPPVPRHVLVTKPNQKFPRTAHRECDPIMALKIGLADYLLHRQIDVNGHVYKLRNAFSDWADPEDTSLYPAIVVDEHGDGTFDGAGIKPEVLREAVAPGVHLVKFSDAVQPLTVELWAENKPVRDALTAMLVESLAPLEWRFGFQLLLPHYFNAVATYALTGASGTDDESAVRRRQRKAALVVTATVESLRIQRFAEAQPRLQTEVSTPNDLEAVP